MTEPAQPTKPKGNRWLDVAVVAAIAIGAGYWLTRPTPVVTVAESFAETGAYALEVTIEPMSEENRALATMMLGDVPLYPLPVRDATGGTNVYIDPSDIPTPEPGTRVRLTGAPVDVSGTGGVRFFLARELTILH